MKSSLEESDGADSPSAYAFGDFRLDAKRRLLLSQGDEQPLTVTPRVFDTLLYFVQHPGELLVRDALLGEVRPDTDVEENSLSQNVSTLRRLLGEIPGENRYIATVPGRGYRFIADVHARPTRIPEAHRLYLQALRLVDRPTAENCRLAVARLEAALTLDDEFAQAWCWLADARTLAVNVGHAPAEDLAAAEREARRAIALNPRLAAAHSVLGNISAHRGQWVNAESHCLTAISLDDSEAMTLTIHAAVVLQSVGHLKRALRQLHDAYPLAPADPRMLLNLAIAYSIAGSDAKALEYADLALKFGFPKEAQPLPLVFAHAAARAGRHDEAAEHILLLMPRGLPAAEPVRLVYGALANPDGRSVAVEAVCGLLEQCSEMIMRTGGMTVLFVSWLAQLGRPDLAFEVANRSVDHCLKGGTLPTNWQPLWTPELAPLRRDERFQQLARRLGFPEYWRQYGPPDE